MKTIVFLSHDGIAQSAELEVGKSLMQIATENGIAGIDADCGGACACGTCHVILDQKGFTLANSAKADELQMLDMTPERAETSRLSCCIQITEKMDGMIVRLPEFQM